MYLLHVLLTVIRRLGMDSRLVLSRRHQHPAASRPRSRL